MINHPLFTALRIAKLNAAADAACATTDQLLNHLNAIISTGALSPKTIKQISDEIEILVQQVIDKRIEAESRDFCPGQLEAYVTDIRDFYVQQRNACLEIFKKHHIAIPI